MRREEKVALVEELRREIPKYPVVALVDIFGVPADMMNEIRQKLRGQGKIKVCKKTLIKLALNEVGNPKLAELTKYLQGQAAIILTHMDPFKLSRLLKESKRRVPAKPGSVAKSEIVIPAGELDIPTQMVASLQKMGAEARVQAGRVMLMKDFKIVTEGEIITKEKSDLLAKLDILPVEQEVKIQAVYENGIIFTPEILNIDEQAVIKQLCEAYVSAFNLSINVCFPTALTIPVLLMKGYQSAYSLAYSVRFPTREVIPALLMLALTHAQVLSGAVKLDQVDGKE